LPVLSPCRYAPIYILLIIVVYASPTKVTEDPVLILTLQLLSSIVIKDDPSYVRNTILNIDFFLLLSLGVVSLVPVIIYLTLNVLVSPVYLNPCVEFYVLKSLVVYDENDGPVYTPEFKFIWYIVFTNNKLICNKSSPKLLPG